MSRSLPLGRFPATVNRTSTSQHQQIEVIIEVEVERLRLGSEYVEQARWLASGLSRPLELRRGENDRDWLRYDKLQTHALMSTVRLSGWIYGYGNTPRSAVILN
jgi:hypothetical protein